MKNFVSVSAVSDSGQLRGIRDICITENLGFPVAIGYQVSSKSINQGTQNSRQPKFSDLGDLSKMTLDYGLIPAVHYYTKDPSTVLGDLEKIANVGVDPQTALLQFNTLPLSPEVLRAVNEMGFKILFKVAVSNKQSSQRGYAVWKGEGTQDVERGNVEPLIAQIEERKDVIDYVMFDPSHGTNLGLNLDADSLAVRFGKSVVSKEQFSHLGLVYAGGINSVNVASLVNSLYSFLPRNRISIDAESGVRKNDKLDLNLIRNYLINSQI